MKGWLRTHLYFNNGKLFGLIQFYRISGVCRAEMKYRSNEFDSNFYCPRCLKSTYNWKWLPYKPKPRTVFYSAHILYGVVLATPTIKTCNYK